MKLVSAEDFAKRILDYYECNIYKNDWDIIEGILELCHEQIPYKHFNKDESEKTEQE